MSLHTNIQYVFTYSTSLSLYIHTYIHTHTYIHSYVFTYIYIYIGVPVQGSHTLGRDKRDDQYRLVIRLDLFLERVRREPRAMLAALRSPFERARQAPDQGRRAPIANRVRVGPRQPSLSFSPCCMYVCMYVCMHACMHSAWTVCSRDGMQRSTACKG